MTNQGHKPMKILFTTSNRDAVLYSNHVPRKLYHRIFIRMKMDQTVADQRSTLKWIDWWLQLFTQTRRLLARKRAERDRIMTKNIFQRKEQKQRVSFHFSPSSHSVRSENKRSKQSCQRRKRTANSPIAGVPHRPTAIVVNAMSVLIIFSNTLNEWRRKLIHWPTK